MLITPAGFVILVGLALFGIWLFVALGSLPGKKAAERNHPQAEAINVLGWLGLLFGGVGWMVALVWAHMKPVGAAPGLPDPVTPEEPSDRGNAAEGAESAGSAQAT